MQNCSNGEAMLDGVPVTPMTEIYWDLFVPFHVSDAHDAMVEAVKGRSNVELFTATVYDKDSCAPSGRFDVAIDASSGDGCGMYRSLMLVQESGELHDLATPPLWYQGRKPQDVVVKVFKFLTDMQFFENIDAFTHNVIDLHEAEATGQVH
ncbi:hypothetical protein ACCS56_30390 [Rhizobium ruizarguesonis]